MKIKLKAVARSAIFRLHDTSESFSMRKWPLPLSANSAWTLTPHARFSARYDRL